MMPYAPAVWGTIRKIDIDSTAATKFERFISTVRRRPCRFARQSSPIDVDCGQHDLLIGGAVPFAMAKSSKQPFSKPVIHTMLRPSARFCFLWLPAFSSPRRGVGQATAEVGQIRLPKS